MNRKKAIDLLERYFDDGIFFKDLSRRVAYQTESQDPGKISKLYEYLVNEMTPSLSEIGFVCKIHKNPDPKFKGPLLFAERNENCNLQTVLIYGHADVVRGNEYEWKKGLNPWKVVKKGGRLYGRGTADNKGQHTINIAAIKYILKARKKKLGFNVKILMETGEENGSPGLREFCRKNKKLLKADVLIASDGPRIKKERPTIFMGSRGVFNFTMKINLRKNNYHSGNWGGLLANPGIILSHAISSLISVSGKINVAGLNPKKIPASVKNVLKKIKIIQNKNDPVININWGEKGLSPEEKVYAWNTLEVLSFKTGNTEKPIHAIPNEAIAHCHIRYVVPSDPKTFVKKIRNHLDKKGFKNVEIRATRGFMSATRLDPAHPWAKWTVNSLKKTCGKEIDVLPNLGGTLPNDAFADILKLPTIWIPHSYLSCSQHAPNEHMLESIVKDALKLMGGVFWDMGEKGTPN